MAAGRDLCLVTDHSDDVGHRREQADCPRMHRFVSSTNLAVERVSQWPGRVREQVCWSPVNASYRPCMPPPRRAHRRSASRSTALPHAAFADLSGDFEGTDAYARGKAHPASHPMRASRPVVWDFVRIHRASTPEGLAAIIWRHDLEPWHSPRSIRNRVAPRHGRDGRGLSGTRSATAARGRAQSAARCRSGRSRSP